MLSAVKEGNRVLVLWGTATQADELKRTVQQIQTITGSSGKVSLENVERLSMASYPASFFDVVLSGVIFPQSIIHSLELLGEITKLVKPHGTVVLREGIIPEANGKLLKTKEKLVSTLKISGLTNVSDAKPVVLSNDETATLKEVMNTNETITVVEIKCEKPNFEVGSSSKLSFAKQVPNKPSAQVAAVWKLDDEIDDDIETIDSDNLLDEDDLKKPDPSSLRVCGTTGKKKACKNCSCGLADELAAENKSSTKESQTKTSSCGSCYLGDAFRCASCPYLGMPAFKPGEKIELSDRQLKADV